jgi:hypothetical protein
MLKIKYWTPKLKEYPANGAVEQGLDMVGYESMRFLQIKIIPLISWVTRHTLSV